MWIVSNDSMYNINKYDSVRIEGNRIILKENGKDLILAQISEDLPDSMKGALPSKILRKISYTLEKGLLVMNLSDVLDQYKYFMEDENISKKDVFV